MPFEPIAITGRACVLPGALSPDELWANVIAGRDLVRAAPAGHWGFDHARILAAADAAEPETAWSDRGGYVEGFERAFDAALYSLDANKLSRLDPLFRWLLHTGRGALADAVAEPAALRRAGLIVGNLSYPTRGLADLANAIWAGREPEMAYENRFCSGLPAHMTATALGLGGEALALDAACASSLYALKIACDRLQAGEADLMLAAAVNHADDLFLHIGFSALQALSPSGRSRPFHRDADGLLPAEGAVCVALERLADAEQRGARVLGVIRGLGISNDGRARGLLVPDDGGQVRAMEAAYALSGLEPADIGLAECHATGTAAGDGVEIESMARVFADVPDLPLGSLKSNMGHLITAAGLAGLLKVLGAMDAGVRPPTLNADAPIDAFEGTPLRPLEAAEPWDATGPRRAVVNAFGFGGNNAHLIVEEWRPATGRSYLPPQSAEPPSVAVTAMGMVTGAGRGTEAFRARLFGSDDGGETLVSSVELPLKGLRYPPTDLKHALAQQTLLLEAVFQVADELAGMDATRVGCLVGMGCDPGAARYALRFRTPERRQALGLGGTEGAVCPPLNAAGVIGTMPNIPANRLNAQFDWRGFGYSVSAEELSGIAAVRLAARALDRGEVDAVVVGAVEATDDAAHEAAFKAIWPTGRPAPQRQGDAAVVLVLRRADADDALATLRLRVEDDAIDVMGRRVEARFGHAHAAIGLLGVAAHVVAAGHGVQPSDDGPLPALAAGGAEQAVIVQSFSGRRDGLGIIAPAKPSGVANRVPGLACFRGPDLADLAARLASGEGGGDGHLRLAVTADDGAELERRLGVAADQLRRGEAPSGPGLYFGEGEAAGELAFVFPGAAAAYAGMGRGFLLAFPHVAAALAKRHPVAAQVAHQVYAEGRAREQFDQLKGCALVCQAHVLAARDVLGLRPDAVLGLSSGETNSLVAMGAWRDMDAMFEEIAQSDMYGTYLTGACESAREAWDLPADTGVRWAAWRLLAPLDAVRVALADEPRARVTIINAPGDCVLAGDEQAVRRVVERLIDRVAGAQAIDLGHPMVVHCEEMAPYEDVWRRIHTRRTHEVPGVRFYANHTGHAYTPTRETAADNLTGQAMAAIDFPRTVEQAYADGVRTFLELGPRDTTTSAIGKILGDRPHLALALDGTGGDDLARLVDVAARLHAAGHLADPGPLSWHLGRIAALAPEGDARDVDELRLVLPAHRPPVPPPAAAPSADTQFMHPSPPLPPVARLRPVAPVAPQEPAMWAASDGNLALAPVVAAHQEFIRSQTESYNQFLALQQRHFPGFLGSVAEAPPVSSPMLPSMPAPKPVDADPPGPSFDRAQLEMLASGRISDVLGSEFECQDGYRRQVRMPEPPLLLADRVTRLTGEPGTLGLGSISTKTDVATDAWYLHHGRMPPGVVIESGQADLLLISWLGIDFVNKGERVYRLLGCELTFHEGGLPKPGDTLCYDIHVDGHAKTGDVRLFFFHYDCHIGDRLALSVREGQAGFFTDDELAGSGGVLWDAAEDVPDPAARLDPPPCVTAKRAFDAADVAAFVGGNAHACFGAGFEMAATHTRTPSTPVGRLQLIDRVTSFEPTGGPWGRGYLCAESDVAADHWFYAGHFKDDPCMPGTLMADAAVQALSFTMAAYGFTIPRDGWRFEPAPGEAFTFLCRGQVIPDGPHLLTYEVFVEEIVDGPRPLIRAALLCRSDGFKVFQCRRFALRLVPDWPLVEAAPAIPHMVGPEASVPGDLAALMACAWGPPSAAFGAMYRPFDGGRKVPRLPGPPYHFVSRIAEVDCPAGTPTVDGSLAAEYQVPAEAWYFRDNGRALMPYAVLMEVLLQPCGWLASYMGFALTDADLAFRNLDGDGAIVHGNVGPGAGTITTRTRLTRFARLGDLTVVFFRVDSSLDGEPLMEMNTSFGFFTAEALANQSGLPASDDDRRRRDKPSEIDHDLHVAPPTHPPLAKHDLLMVDAVSGYWPDGGEAGLGRIRGRQAIDPGAWYFKAHFYQDPVQPGSLGIEALVQLLQAYVGLAGLAADLHDPMFEPFALGEPLVWKYRGQVMPTDGEVTSDLEITRVELEAGAVLVVARGSLWVDGMRIYEVENLAVRAVAGDAPTVGDDDIVLDLVTAPWLADHCPTQTVPALPFMVLVDLMAGAALACEPDLKVVAIEDVQAFRWAVVGPEGLRLAPLVKPVDGGFQVTLMMTADGRERPVIQGRVLMAEAYPAPPPALGSLDDARPEASPYEAGHLFHGPAFQIMADYRLGPAGADFDLDAGAGGVPVGTLHPCLLDGVFHGVPHDRLHLWFPDVGDDGIGYPQRARRIAFHGEIPASGPVRAQVRARGSAANGVTIEARLSCGDSVFCSMDIDEAVMPKGPLGRAAPAERRAFLAQRRPVAGLRLSHDEEGATSLDVATVKASNWLPGTLEAVYATRATGEDLVRVVAIKEHVAAMLGVHPSAVEVDGGAALHDGRRIDVVVEQQDGGVRVRTRE